ncbi:DUF4148 domain-containing protein [Comamonas composti]|uniref:DUF4148 domain-containing protein n=1 Tax=Comamonas composti TaxID=408558 RepID=UPI0004173115|nr:DUF4148 domain-containing protein [Comamonas composti]
MNNARRLAVLAALAASAFAAHADFRDGEYPATPSSASTLTHAQVAADFQAARANNTLPDISESPAPAPSVAKAQTSNLTRTQVSQEAATALKQGKLNYGG